MDSQQYSISKKPAAPKIVLVILALVLISGMAYGGWKIFSKPESASLPEQPATEPIARSEPEVTTDWKVYRNEKYGYEIKYPRGWYLYDTDLADIWIQPDRNDPQSIPGPRAKAVEIAVSEKSLSSLDEHINKRYAGASYSKANVYIAGVEGVKAVQTEEAIGQGQPIIFLPKDDMVYELNSNLGDVQTFEQIIRTFRFIK